MDVPQSYPPGECQESEDLTVAYPPASRLTENLHPQITYATLKSMSILLNRNNNNSIDHPRADGLMLLTKM